MRPVGILYGVSAMSGGRWHQVQMALCPASQLRAHLTNVVVRRRLAKITIVLSPLPVDLQFARSTRSLVIVSVCPFVRLRARRCVRLYVGLCLCAVGLISHADQLQLTYCTYAGAVSLDMNLRRYCGHFFDRSVRVRRCTVCVLRRLMGKPYISRQFEESVNAFLLRDAVLARCML